jgi:CubicO group peptidase (beta-lactamase class C family)
MAKLADPHQRLFEALERAVEDGVFPGAVALVWKAGATLYHEAHGCVATHPLAAVHKIPVERDTVYDLASLTKVLATTTLFAIAVSEGRVTLDTEVPEPWQRACPNARLRDVLEHCAGFAAHREYFVQVEPFDREAVLERVVQTPVEYSLRERSVYSDLGFIVLGAWLERLFDDALDRVFADRIAFRLGLEGGRVQPLAYRRLYSRALADRAVEAAIAPTEVYDASLHEDVPSHLSVRAPEQLAHGAVHDDNAFVMGGVAGHAGLFGRAAAVLEVAQAWLEPDRLGFSTAVRDRFWRPSTVSNSTRRLGFDGASADGTGTAGRAVGPKAVGHTGFTGTSLWIDPEHPGGPWIAILLSNRVHPVRTNDRIQAFRPLFHELAAQL